MERWIGNVAVVTGASSGIGYAITQDLVKHGMKVAGLDREMDGIMELEKELNKNGFIKGIKCDLTNAEEVKAAINWIETNWGEINVLVNSAGVSLREPLISGTGEGMSKTFEINVIGLSRCTREVTTVMKRRNVKQGHIFNICSVYGHRITDRPHNGPYVASKHSVVVLSKILRNELNQEKIPVRVTNISPGFVATGMTKRHWQYQDTPRLQPADISNCVLFALSTPPHVNVSELTVETTEKVSPKDSGPI